MGKIKIKSNDLDKYLKTQTLYFHDSHILKFSFSNNQLNIKLEKYDKSIVNLIFNDIQKIEYRVGDSNEIDLKNRILDIDLNINGEGLLANILLLNMSFVDVYFSSLVVDGND